MTHLTLQAVSVARAGRCIISPLDLNLHGGTMTALVGPNGTGKTTLLAAIAGHLPYQGAIQLDGAPVDIKVVSYLPQTHGVSSRLTVLEVLLLGRRETLGWRISDQDLSAATQVMQHFMISDFADRSIATLSGGQQQIVLLAQRLMRKPRVVILDEPTSALDLHHQLSVLAVLRSYAQENDAIILAAIHDLNLASRQCDSIALLMEGDLHCHGDPHEVLTAQTIKTVYRVEIDAYRNQSGHVLNIPISPEEVGRR
ncbi:MAG: ABC transporter ATP-binding protein [Alphaproteobacteria bacterium]|nr:ABC transporter ATP-binding protein [Alphaproteobacteria bacterium]